MRLSFIPLLILGYIMLEIAGFILVGDMIGVLPTLGLILLSGLVGTMLMRAQGLAVFRRIQQESASGKVPGRDLVHAFMILLAGILLLLPGFLTDIIGLTFFIPPVRDAVWNFLKSRMTIVTNVSGFGPRGSAPRGRGPVVDLDDDDFHRTGGKPSADSPWNRQIDRE